MANELTVTEWEVPADVLPTAPSPGVLYVLPPLRDADLRPAYRPESLLLVKAAAASAVELKYSLPPDDRRFVDHFAADPQAIEIWLALAGPITDVFLFGLGYAFNSLLRRRGVSEADAEAAPLRLKLARLDPKTGVVKGLKMEGRKVDVIDAVRALKGESDVPPSTD
jgi:hypothetical protein